MSKLNTSKKGMAKKALSISLAAAMLATSNVPAWATEFDDGSDVTFSSGVQEETPAVETPAVQSAATEEVPAVEDDKDVEAASAGVITENDLIIDLKIKDGTSAKNTSVIWKNANGGYVTVEGTIKKKDGSVLPDTGKKLKYRWVDESDTIVNGYASSVLTEQAGEITIDAQGNVSGISLQPSSEQAGKTIRLFIDSAADDTDKNIQINTGITVNVEKRELVGFTDLTSGSLANSLKEIINKKADGKLVYNGFEQTINTTALKDSSDFVIRSYNDKKAEVAVDNSKKDYFDVKASSATNAGEYVNVTVSAKQDSPYVGSVTQKIRINEFEVSEPSEVFTGSIAKGLKYTYTGNKISIPKDKVTFGETVSANNGADGKFRGDNLASAIVKVESKTATVGSSNVVITFDPSADVMKNYKFAGTGNKTIELEAVVDNPNTITIEKRDLAASSTVITVKNGKIPTNTTVKQLKDNPGNYFIFTDISGAVLNPSAQDINEVELSVKKNGTETVTDDSPLSTGSFNVTFSANVNAKNLKGSQTINVNVTESVIVGASFENVSDTPIQSTYFPVYTGSEIKPSQSDLGKLTVKVKNNSDTQDVEFNSSEWKIVGYKNNVNATYFGSEFNANEYYGKNGSNVNKMAYVEIEITTDNSTHKTERILVPFYIKALEVTKDDIKVPAKVAYNKAYTDVKEYKLPLEITAKDVTNKVTKTLAASDYTVEYIPVDGNPNYDANGKVAENSVPKNEIGDKITYKVTLTNKNYVFTDAISDANVLKVDTNNITKTIDLSKVQPEVNTVITGKSLSDTVVSVAPSSYVYTGSKIIPTYTVMDGVLQLYKDVEYKEIDIPDAISVGTGKVIVEGIAPFYDGKATGTFTITPANTSDVKIEIPDVQYTGGQVKPDSFKATLNGIDVSDQFEIVGCGENNKAGKGTAVIRPVAGNKNFTGSDITAEFNIVNETLTATLNVYNAKGSKYTTTSESTNYKENRVIKGQFTFDGAEKTFAKALVSNLKKKGNLSTTATVDDLEIKYADNICGKTTNAKKINLAYVYVVAKDGSGFTGEKSFTTADGTIVKGVIDYIAFEIANVEFVAENVSIKNGVYAAGLPVKPQVTIQIGGNTLVEGKDYKVTLIEKKDDPASAATVAPIDVTSDKPYGVKIEGLNGYSQSAVITDANATDGTQNLIWGIDKKDIADCDVTVKDGVVSVLNGYIPVPATEYTSKNNGDGTYTVTAVATSKSYKGSKTVKADGKAEDEKPEAPMIAKVVVSGNKATAILSGDAEGATGYDFVISKDRDCITNKDYDKVNKNILKTETDFTYVQQGTYYAYCHAWKRDESGKKIFSDWSSAYPFVVTAITPDQPVITSVKANRSTVTVTYTQAANATGYDVVLGTATKKVAGETRPVNYGELVKKNVKGNTVTVTFKNVPAGTYYAGLHAFNRTSEDGKKVFSPWSNTKKVTVK